MRHETPAASPEQDQAPENGRFVNSTLRVVATFGALLAFNLGIWAWAILAFRERPILLGTSLLAYSFGLRHAFDADHIAAIDNVVRKLTGEQKRPYCVGLFFSLGHSTVVLVASIVVGLTAAGVHKGLENGRFSGSTFGTLVSAGFLLAVGLANLVTLKSVWAAFVRERTGLASSAADEAEEHNPGLLTRLFRGTFALVSRSWHMYPVGLLFGLGFDTASEIGLLAIAAVQATHGASLWTILIFPLLFTAGMSFVDFADSVLMTHAYGWVSLHPIRKLWYNLTITSTSVIIALFIGSLEALDLLAAKLQLTGRPWSIVTRLNNELGLLGFAIVGFFIVSWIVSFALFHLRGFDQLGAAPAAPLPINEVQPWN